MYLHRPRSTVCLSKVSSKAAVLARNVSRLRAWLRWCSLGFVDRNNIAIIIHLREVLLNQKLIQSRRRVHIFQRPRLVSAHPTAFDGYSIGFVARFYIGALE